MSRTQGVECRSGVEVSTDSLCRCGQEAGWAGHDEDGFVVPRVNSGTRGWARATQRSPFFSTFDPAWFPMQPGKQDFSRRLALFLLCSPGQRLQGRGQGA